MNDRRLMLPDSLQRRLGAGDDVNLREPIRGLTVLRHGRIYEARSTHKVEARNADDGTPRIDGYATTYDDPYDMYGGPGNGLGWSEIIAKGAAAKSAREVMSRLDERHDVFLFFDHDGLPLASALEGTLTLSSDGIGLRSIGDLDAASPYSMEIYRRVQKRQLRRMSFAFQVLRERWEDGDGDEADSMSAPVRRIQEVKLFDTSVVSFPANPGTTVFANSADGMSVVAARAELGGMPAAVARAELDALRQTA